MLFLPFPLPGAASPPTDIVVLSRRVTLTSHGVKMSSLALLHFLATLRPITSHLEAKTKH
jgi:hypothetical protein